jgi:hypothetical protein
MISTLLIEFYILTKHRQRSTPHKLYLLFVNNIQKIIIYNLKLHYKNTCHIAHIFESELNAFRTSHCRSTKTCRFKFLKLEYLYFRKLKLH